MDGVCDLLVKDTLGARLLSSIKRPYFVVLLALKGFETNDMP